MNRFVLEFRQSGKWPGGERSVPDRLSQTGKILESQWAHLSPLGGILPSTMPKPEQVRRDKRKKSAGGAPDIPQSEGSPGVPRLISMAEFRGERDETVKFLGWYYEE